MTSTFHGLETARRGMTTQQSALHTTGHNISNANTEGYTRQRVNFGQTEPYPNAARNAPRMPGQIGTGVEADFIQRVREGYLDIQYRGENAQANYWETRHASYERIEDLINEPSEDGIGGTMDEFWNALQDLSVNPEDSGARSVVRQRGIALADTFNYVANTLQANKDDLKGEIDTKEKEVNSLLRKIHDVNEQIGRMEPHGQMPNDLYDERDRLIDELSGMMNIEVQEKNSGGQALDAADGIVNVYMVDEDDNRITKLIDGEKREYKELSINSNGEEGNHAFVTDAKFEWVKKAGDDISNESGSDEDIEFVNSPGKLKALVESFGYKNEDGEVTGTYPDVMNKLDDMVYTFASAFNKQHRDGYGLNESTDISFFDSGNATKDNKQGAAKNISMDENIEDSVDNIAAASEYEGDEEDAYAGDGSNAQKLSDIKDLDLGFDGSTTNVQSYYRNFIGELAVDTDEANQKMKNTDNLRESVNNRRKEVSSVSLNEEMTNMIQFQHAYNASARNITMIDEMLDRIINNMGVVGR
ncbi:flagellar hook-associated protein FlgK [Alteribacillus sp. JSM 102045]|uniref:flagellar hook-associated protein FlgK n=1 Tax=Alteribacillus sp. JSM 102045 TaxID=1562101 RepID=UPI0035BFAD41